MTIPQVFGKGKIGLVRGEDGDDRAPRQRRNRGGGGGALDLTFSLGGGGAGPALPGPPAFNVLYVETPKVGLLQAPEMRWLVVTCAEAVDLVRPLLRFGFPETSLRTKCPYYNEELYAEPAGALLANYRVRTLFRTLAGVGGASEAVPAGQQPHQQQQPQQQPAHQQRRRWWGRKARSEQQELQQQQQQAEQPMSEAAPAPLAGLQQGSSSSPPSSALVAAALGPGNLGFLAQAAADDAHGAQPLFAHHQLVPRRQLLVPDIPSGTLVLALNLMAYWLIMRGPRRGGGGIIG